MTTKELRSYIDRILGNSLRVLLPSYWWKRLFGAVVDKVEELDKQGKNKQDILVSGKNIKTINNTSLLGGGNIDLGQDKQLSLFLPAYGSDITLSEEEKASNRQVHVACRWPKEKERVGINAFVISSVGKYIPVAVSMIGINRGGWLLVDVNWIGNIYDYSWKYAVDSNGEISGVQQSFLADDALSTTSLRPVQNKVVTSALNAKADKSQIPTKLSQLEKDIEIGSSITVDSKLSETSTNPVQNKVVTEALNAKADKTYVDNAVANIAVDSELSETSENPVQNKVLTAELAKRKNIIVEHYKSYKVEEFLNSLDVKKQHPTSAYPPPSYCLESKDLYDEEFEDIFGDWLKNLGEKFYTSEVVLDDSSHTDIAVVKPWFFYDKDYYGVVFDYPYSRAVEGVGYDTAEIRIEFDNDTSRKYIVSVNLKNAYSKTRIINLSDVPENDTKYIKQLEGHVKDYGFEYQYYGIINNDYITTMIPLSVTYDKNYGAPYIYISGSYFFRDSASTLKKHNIIYRLSTAAVTVGPIFNDLSYIDEVIENTAYKTYVDNAIANLTNEIITNEEVIAAALNDLNKRLKLLENVE